MRAGLIGGHTLQPAAAAAGLGRGAQANFQARPAMQQALDMAALARQQQQQQQQRQQQQQQQRAAAAASATHKSFPGKLTQIKEFPVEKSNQQAYKLQKALIDQKIVPCINVRPYVFHDLMMTLPDFV